MSRGKKLVDLALSLANTSSEEDDSDQDEDFIPTEDVEDKSGSESTADDDSEVANVSSVLSNSPNEWGQVSKTHSFPLLCDQKHTLKNIPDMAHTPLDFFYLMIDDEILQLIADETNKYAIDCKINATNVKSRLNNWKNINTDDVKKFFAILLWFGINPTPHITSPWVKDNFYHNDYVSKIMPRDQFLLLLKCWHFNENEKTDDRLHKLRPLIDRLTTNFKKYLQPGETLVIDESMIPWRGRLRFRQYITNKRHKFGIKVYKLCTEEGYTYNFKIYTGKGDTNPGESHAESIVKHLMSDLLGQGRTLFADNFYSSINLVSYLLENKTRYCGTLRCNRRGLPNIIKNKGKKGEIIGAQKDGVKIIKWTDKKPVLMITSCDTHDLTLVESNKKNRSGQIVMKPQCVLDYNVAKKGVDLSHQLSSYYTVLRRGKKWYKKVAVELIFGTALVNAWIMYKKYSGNNLTILQFKEALSKALIKETTQEDPPSRPRTPKRIHTFQSYDASKKRKKCTGCYKKLRECMSSRDADKKVKKVKTYCSTCDGEPAMCLKCFNDNHKES